MFIKVVQMGNRHFIQIQFASLLKFVQMYMIQRVFYVNTCRYRAFQPLQHWSTWNPGSHWSCWPWPMTFKLDLWPWPGWPWPLTFFSDSRLKNSILMFDIDLWPMTLTFNLILAGVKVDLHAKYQDRRSNGLAVRALTNRQTNKQTHGTDNITSSANAGGKNIQ